MIKGPSFGHYLFSPLRSREEMNQHCPPQELNFTSAHPPELSIQGLMHKCVETMFESENEVETRFTAPEHNSSSPAFSAEDGTITVHETSNSSASTSYNNSGSASNFSDCNNGTASSSTPTSCRSPDPFRALHLSHIFPPFHSSAVDSVSQKNYPFVNEYFLSNLVLAQNLATSSNFLNRGIAATSISSSSPNDPLLKNKEYLWNLNLARDSAFKSYASQNSTDEASQPHIFGFEGPVECPDGRKRHKLHEYDAEEGHLGECSSRARTKVEKRSPDGNYVVSASAAGEEDVCEAQGADGWLVGSVQRTSQYERRSRRKRRPRSSTEGSSNEPLICQVCGDVSLGCVLSTFFKYHQELITVY